MWTWTIKEGFSVFHPRKLDLSFNPLILNISHAFHNAIY